MEPCFKPDFLHVLASRIVDRDSTLTLSQNAISITVEASFLIRINVRFNSNHKISVEVEVKFPSCAFIEILVGFDAC